MRRKISQSEARRLKKRVEYLEHVINTRQSSFSSAYPGGVNFLTINGEGLHAQIVGRLDAASMIGHHIVAKWIDGKLHLYAVDAWSAK